MYSNGPGITDIHLQALRLPNPANRNLILSVKPSELFGVFVRAAGFLIVIYGLWEIWGGIENIAENILLTSQDDNSEQTSSLSFFAFGIPAILLGAIFFFLADWIVRLAYRDPTA